MVNITCMCGFTAECGRFIPPNLERQLKGGRKVIISQNYYLCPACKVKFRGPKSITEIGVQVLQKGRRYELPLANKVDQEIKEWQRDKFLRHRPAGTQLALIRDL